jgi:hypothetical protein
MEIELNDVDITRKTKISFERFYGCDENIDIRIMKDHKEIKIELRLEDILNVLNKFKGIK